MGASFGRAVEHVLHVQFQQRSDLVSLKIVFGDTPVSHSPMMTCRYRRRVPSLCLLGHDHQVYGSVAAHSITERVAAAMSIGADSDSPSLVFKDDPDTLNEDALCVVTDGARTGIAVADAHFGPESSHRLIERLHERWVDGLPASSDELLLLLAAIGEPAMTGSETALLAAVHDGDSGVGFGWSIGDASLVIVGAGHDATPRNPRNHSYVSASGDDAVPIAFSFKTQPGDMVLAFTDGVDECHYRHPETSLRPHHITEIVQASGNDPRRVVADLTQRALDGVDGHPGGQDNIAIVAVRC